MYNICAWIFFRKQRSEERNSSLFLSPVNRSPKKFREMGKQKSQFKVASCLDGLNNQATPDSSLDLHM